MIKKLLESVREYKKDTILTPIYVVLEVIMEDVQDCGCRIGQW